MTTEINPFVNMRCIELEESIEKYQRGIQLKKHCDQKLKESFSA